MSQLVRLEGKHTTQNAHCAVYTIQSYIYFQGHRFNMLIIKCSVTIYHHCCHSIFSNLGTSNFLSLGPRWLNSLKDSGSGETSAGFLKTIFPRQIIYTYIHITFVHFGVKLFSFIFQNCMNNAYCGFCSNRLLHYFPMCVLVCQRVTDVPSQVFSII